MTLQEIKDAIAEGSNVYWSHKGYQVKLSGGAYYIVHEFGSCIGLTWQDGVTLNGDESDFFRD